VIDFSCAICRFEFRHFAGTEEECGVWIPVQEIRQVHTYKPTVFTLRQLHVVWLLSLRLCNPTLVCYVVVCMHARTVHCWQVRRHPEDVHGDGWFPRYDLVGRGCGVWQWERASLHLHAPYVCTDLEKWQSCGRGWPLAIFAKDKGRYAQRKVLLRLANRSLVLHFTFAVVILDGLGVFPMGAWAC
jgi:hypothetical protein